jgi:anaerobic carbon-monoxide dehydrogenase iron sulfur subunit
MAARGSRWRVEGGRCEPALAAGPAGGLRGRPGGAMIFKVSVGRCIACGKCELACAFAHGSESQPAKTRINIYRRGPDLGTPVVCLQCHDAACVAVCPTDALLRNIATGAVEVDLERCVLCRACVAACPFGNMVWDEPHHRVAKCDLCGGAPQCVPFCPTGALLYVPADEAARRPEPLDRGVS